MRSIVIFLVCFWTGLLHGQDWYNVYHFNVSHEFSKENVSDFQFISTNIGYFSTVESTDGSSPGDAYLYMTKNAGLNWDKIYTLNEYTMGSSASLYFDFLDERDFFIYESTNGGLCHGKAFRDSINMGTAFTPYPPPYINNIHKDTIILSAFTDEQYIFLLLMKEDTLKKIPISDSYIYGYGFCDHCDLINSVCFFNGFGAAIGKRNGLNILFRSNNNMEHWDSDTLQIEGTLKQVYFINHSIGFILCNDSMLYRTSNGGLDWDRIELPQPMHINDIQFGTYKGYITGKEGLIASSADEGIHWKMEEINTSNSIEFISVVNEVGYVMDSDGHIFTNNPIVYGTNAEVIKPVQKLFPNPLNDQCTIVSNETIVACVLFNVSGQIVPVLAEINDNTAMLDLSFISSGIYYLRVCYNECYIIKKVIKN
ncbi:MAG: T9SS type A sorting domain-containing protein [Bacteroidota bacterium]